MGLNAIRRVMARLPVGARIPLAAALLYVALWPLMNVEFLAHRFPAPFLTGRSFWGRYSRMAGGPAEYAANLFSQTYWRHWAGVLAFTLLALAAWATARGILRKFGPGRWDWPAAVFPLAILILTRRDAAISYVLPMLVGLAAAWLYMTLVEGLRGVWPQRVVAAASPMVAFPLCYLLASGSLYFCAMGALYELVVRKRALLGLVWIAAGAAVPCGVSRVFYEPDLSELYMRGLRYSSGLVMPEFDTVTNGLFAVLYLFAPVGAAVAWASGRFRIGGRLAPRLRLAARIAGYAALALLASRLALLRLETTGWIYADYLLNAAGPEEALAALARSADVSDTSRFLTGYALARTGRLTGELFHYPQQASSDALLLRDVALDTFPTVAKWRSDLYLELGRVNESQRWAHEALAMEGETPRVLERLALVNVMNGSPDAARTFYRALERVPFQGGRARERLRALDRDPTLRADPLVARLRPLMLTKDYVGDFPTEQILLQSLDANPANRTAFEYLLAHYMLTSDMNGLAAVAPHLKDFYREMPAHIEEMLLGFRNVNGTLPPGIDESAIHSETATRFQNFVYIWTRVQNGPAEDAWKALKPRFGDTYWFFYVFGRTAAGPPFETGESLSPGAAKSP